MGGFFRRPGDDQRCSGLINENTVNLIHNGKIKFPLGQRFPVKLHVVPEIIKSELVVGTIGDVRVIGLFSFFVIHVMDDNANFHAKKTVYFTHPLGITLGKIIIYRYHMNAFSGQGIEISGQVDMRVFPSPFSFLR